MEKTATGTVVWFRRDLRIHDHQALHAAWKRGGPVACVYVQGFDEDKLARAQQTWMSQARKALHRSLMQKYETSLWCCKPSAHGYESVAQALKTCLDAIGATHLFYSRRYEPDAATEDDRIEQLIKEGGFNARGFEGHLLFQPMEVDKWMSSGKRIGRAHYGTLLPMLHAFKQMGDIGKVLPAPPSLPCLPRDSQRKLELVCTSMTKKKSQKEGALAPWADKLMQAWDVTEEGTRKALDEFIRQKLQKYEAQRSRADLQAVSCLSPYLASGMISPRTVYAASLQGEQGGKQSPVSKTFSRRLLWRDLAYWQFYRYPHLSHKPLRAHHTSHAWSQNREHLIAWQKGRTGFPIVDAGMRQLWHTGWMPQNIRMATASFLTEYLNISWLEGLSWYRDTLVDHDLAINSMMWQNAGRSGLDQWNFVIHPITSPKSSDPTGEYVRTWVPELAKLPTRWIHQPWEAPDQVLDAAQIRMEVDYPTRIIDNLEDARNATLKQTLDMQRSADPFFHTVGGYDVIWFRDISSAEKEAYLSSVDFQAWEPVFVHVFTRKELRHAGSVEERTQKTPTSSPVPSTKKSSTARKRTKVQRASNQTLLRRYYREAQEDTE
uniref:Photolyase/cryptochrome alpha/beta domain-containing protein n=1 Tax=Picocystis salinarum TaxID=88271 RepID=A0A7S3XEG1_9CHLO|mmetsp:Transcript_3457/g.21709  ORF Transcript_3457/g.21709 Transcript_3457/m.21709 type:complete len:605 (+) Transcript_3457:221-2035(+)|eukprot:CAMPEP_0183831532 /NCGR_PEP_ID=MMETSP0807_2-20130328/4749_1 /TAXON_ID=88271 /ORGANISM="Picocystis salinarum, Strain CCMP1897" /LENGTH=604 /DNA_ID=CAMNT_0026077047 /DNA_START=151 /DNA_END=1965 /DNA_ORIENTATION=-